jgi:membrane fusion protein, copper/silver efflux system
MNKLLTLTALIVGIAIGAITYPLIQAPEDSAQSNEPQPLYWVAPMDPNYRRDEPGLSPMGMKLVPVYPEDSARSEDKGSIYINPSVENNLGVRTALARNARFHSQINTVGYISFDEDNLQHIHARVSGWVEKLYAKAEGERIKKGRPLYALYSPELVNAQEEFVDSLRRGGKQLIRSARERLLALDIPAEQIDRLQKTRQVQRLITVNAPQAGVIESLDIREGMFIQPGNNILSIGNLDQVWVIAEIFERDAGQVSESDKVTMRLDYLPGRQWDGQVDYIYPTLDDTTRTLRIRLRFDNSDRALKPNMFTQITIHHMAEQDSLLIPFEAVIRNAQQNRVVLAQGEGRYKSIAVTLGKVGNEQVEILEGLNEGDEIVTSAQFLLDSESSISSDFIRMHNAPNSVQEEMDHTQHQSMNAPETQEMDHSMHQGMDHSKQADKE